MAEAVIGEKKKRQPLLILAERYLFRIYGFAIYLVLSSIRKDDSLYLTSSQSQVGLA